MTSESPERQLFNKYKEIMIKHLGNKAPDDLTINRAGRKLFPAWGGVFPSDRVKLRPFHYGIINVDPHDKKGSHWLAYLWDSYGRTILKLVPGLVKSIRDSGWTVGKTNLIPRMEQIGYTSETCGPQALAWL